jgi:hypothetical protein
MQGFRNFLRSRGGLIAGITVSVLIALQALAQSANAAGSTELLAALGTGGPEALASRAQRLADGGDPEAATQLAKRALHMSPVYQPAARAMGMSMIAAAGDNAALQEQGKAMMEGAGKLGWRDARTMSWLMQERFKAGDLPDGAAYVDALALRIGVGAEMFQLVSLLAADPAMKSGLVARLSQSPDWRLDFFRNARIAQGQQATDVADMLVALKASPAPPVREEVAPVVSALVKSGEIARAQQLKGSLLGGARAKGNSLVADGDFEQVEFYNSDESRLTPFDWAIAFGRGFTASIERDDRDNGILYVTAEGLRDTIVAKQLVVLAPATYSLGFDMLEQSGGASERFQWQLRCSTDPQSGLRIEAKKSAGGRLVANFTISDAACPAYFLELVSIKNLSRSQASAKIDNVAVTKS